MNRCKNLVINSKSLKVVFLVLTATLLFNSCDNQEESSINANIENMMIRLSEIEIEAEYLEEYKAILKKESEASVRLEPGVIAIYPMYQKDNPTQVRIIEIYADRQAYESHLKTPHFQEYKTTTLQMVKSLRLVDMEAIDAETMPQIFRKLKE